MSEAVPQYPPQCAVVGLGNPGERFHMTRHNLGVRIVDAFVGCEDWQDKGNCRVCIHRVGFIPVAFIMAQVGMNESGRAIAPILREYAIPLDRILVIHDELDLPVRGIRFSEGSENDRHRGVKDLALALESPGFCRLRIGIDHPRNAVAEDFGDFVQPEGSEAADAENPVYRWVLSVPPRAQLGALSETLNVVCELTEVFIQSGIGSAMERLAQAARH